MGDQLAAALGAYDRWMYFRKLVNGKVAGGEAEEAPPTAPPGGTAAPPETTRFAGYFERALLEARDAGQVPAELDAKGTAQALLAYLYGTILLAKTADDVAVMERLARHALALVGARPS